MDATTNSYFSKESTDSIVIQKLDKLRTDMEDQFLHLKYATELLQQQMSRIKSNSYPSKQLPSSCSSARQNPENRVNNVFHDIDEMHKEVLKENLEQMVKDIDLENSDLLDDLQADECLTSDEAAEIIRKPARRDQVRKLVLHLRRKSGKRFTTFLENLQKSSNYPHIAEKLMQSYNRKRSDFSSSAKIPKCLVCVLKQDVLVKDVVDKLYSNGLVSTETFELILDDVDTDKRVIWDMILTDLKRSSDPRKARQGLQEALAKKYEHIAARISKTRFPEIICKCKNIMQNILFVQTSLKSGSTGSLGDISTTSERKPYNINVSDGVSSKESVHSEKSEISGKIDFTNIPNTVAWLESIPNDLNVHVREVTTDEVLTELINDDCSVISIDIDSVSKMGDLKDSADDEHHRIANVDTFACDEQNFHNFNRDQIVNNVKFSDEDKNMSVSYASVVSGKSDIPKHIAKKQNPNQNSNSNVRVERSISTSSGCNPNFKMTSGNKPVESLSEIGTIYLSKSEISKSAAADCIVLENRKQLTNKSRNLPSNAINSTNKHKSTSKLKTESTRQTDNKLHSGPPGPSDISSVHSAILENVFFEEQRKIHGNLPSRKNEDNSKSSTVAKSYPQEPKSDTLTQTGCKYTENGGYSVKESPLHTTSGITRSSESKHKKKKRRKNKR